MSTDTTTTRTVDPRTGETTNTTTTRTTVDPRTMAKALDALSKAAPESSVRVGARGVYVETVSQNHTMLAESCVVGSAKIGMAGCDSWNADNVNAKAASAWFKGAHTNLGAERVQIFGSDEGLKIEVFKRGSATAIKARATLNTCSKPTTKPGAQPEGSVRAAQGCKAEPAAHALVDAKRLVTALKACAAGLKGKDRPSFSDGVRVVLDEGKVTLERTNGYVLARHDLSAAVDGRAVRIIGREDLRAAAALLATSTDRVSLTARGDHLEIADAENGVRIILVRPAAVSLSFIGDAESLSEKMGILKAAPAPDDVSMMTLAAFKNATKRAKADKAKDTKAADVKCRVRCVEGRVEVLSESSDGFDSAAAGTLVRVQILECALSNLALKAGDSFSVEAAADGVAINLRKTRDGFDSIAVAARITERKDEAPAPASDDSAPDAPAGAPAADTSDDDSAPAVARADRLAKLASETATCERKAQKAANLAVAAINRGELGVAQSHLLTAEESVDSAERAQDEAAELASAAAEVYEANGRYGAGVHSSEACGLARIVKQNTTNAREWHTKATARLIEAKAAPAADVAPTTPQAESYTYVEPGNSRLEIEASTEEGAIVEAQKMVQASYDADTTGGAWEAHVEDSEGVRIATVRSKAAPAADVAPTTPQADPLQLLAEQMESMADKARTCDAEEAARLAKLAGDQIMRAVTLMRAPEYQLSEAAANLMRCIRAACARVMGAADAKAKAAKVKAAPATPKAEPSAPAADVASTTPATPQKWYPSEGCGPIQMNRVAKAARSLSWEARSQWMLRGIKGGETTRTLTTGLFGEITNPKAYALHNEIGERYGWKVTKAAAAEIAKALTAAAKEAQAAAPEVDETRDPQEVAKLAAKRAAQEAERAAAQAAKNETAAAILAKRPANAAALIVAELVRDESDSMTDYFGSSITKTVAIGWRTGSRESFKQLRKAAATFPETAHLGPDASDDVEHRENYSMGGGNYVKAGDRHSSGWQVVSRDISRSGGRIHTAGTLVDAIPDAPPAPAPAGASTNDNTTAEIITTYHDKRGLDVHIVVPAERMERAAFDDVRSAAKAAGGWYSRAWKGTPGGFAFEDPAAAQAFAAERFAAPKADAPEQAPDPMRDVVQGYVVGRETAEGLTYRAFPKQGETADPLGTYCYGGDDGLKDASAAARERSAEDGNRWVLVPIDGNATARLDLVREPEAEPKASLLAPSEPSDDASAERIMAITQEAKATEHLVRSYAAACETAEEPDARRMERSAREYIAQSTADMREIPTDRAAAAYVAERLELAHASLLQIVARVESFSTPTTPLAAAAPQCSAECRGWVLEGGAPQVTACETCERCADDVEAAAAALAWLAESRDDSGADRARPEFFARLADLIGAEVERAERDDETDPTPPGGGGGTPAPDSNSGLGGGTRSPDSNSGLGGGTRSPDSNSGLGLDSRTRSPDSDSNSAAARAQTSRESAAADLEARADTLARQIEAKRAPLTQNPTPRRLRIKAGQNEDADRLEQVERGCRALAQAYRENRVPSELAGVTTRAAVERALTASKPTYVENKRRAHLRAMIEDADTPEQREAEAQRKKAAEVEALENSVRFQKIEGFFPTPRPLIERMLDAADIQPDHVVDEPGAGLGHIVEAVQEREPSANVRAWERDWTLADIMERKGLMVTGRDYFTDSPELGTADRVIMNPPFERGQATKMVRAAFEALKPGGRLVSIVPSGGKAEEDLRPWVRSKGGTWQELEPGAFTGPESFRQTGVRVAMIVVDRPERTL